MSCVTNVNYIAKVTARISAAVSPLANKRGFYAGAAIGSGSGLLGVGILAAQYLCRRRTNNREPGGTLRTALTPGPVGQQLPRLPARTQLKPLSNTRSTDRCISCQATAQAKSGGGWYSVNGRTYCQDCAPGAAREANIDLVAPLPPPALSAATTYAATAAGAANPELLQLKKRVRTRAEPGQVKVQMGVDKAGKSVHYAVKGLLLDRASHKASRKSMPTGLALTPALQTKTQANGDVEVQEDRTRWYLTHVGSGVRLGPQPYARVEDAQGIAEILAQINWHRPRDRIPQQDQQRALATILLYNELLSSQTAAEQAATSEQIPSSPSPIPGVAPPTPSRTPPTPSPAVDPPRPGLVSYPVTDISEQDLTGKLIADPMGGISRVLVDKEDVLFVVDNLGTRYEIYRDQVWAPRYEDFSMVRVAQPINTAKTTTKHCSGCQTNSANTPANHAWYRMDYKSFCPSCAPTYAGQEGWFMDLDSMTSEVK